MNALGIVRKVDHLGRIVIPKELRKSLDVEEGTPMEIMSNGKDVLLRRYQPGCTLCGEMAEKMTSVSGKQICATCVDVIKGVDVG